MAARLREITPAALASAALVALVLGTLAAVAIRAGGLTGLRASRAGLEGFGGDLFVVGDAVAPRQADAAILDGERAGWMI